VAIVDSSATDTHKCAKGVGRSSLNLWFSMIIRAFMQASIPVYRSSGLSRNARVCSFRPY
jgi:hypothetical protein